MTNKKLKEKIARLEAELAEVKEMAVAMKKRADGGVFKPKYGQTYRFITPQGTIYSALWCNNSMNNNHDAIGNCFPTRQSAEDAVRVLKLIQKARESQDGYVPDWEDWTQNKYFAYFESGEIRIRRHITRNVASMFGYWEDYSACEQFVQDNHNELLWFFTEYRR